MKPQPLLEVQNFMKSPEFIWFEACMELIDTMLNDHLTYESFLDGVLIHRLFCRMNVHVKEDNILLPNGDVPVRRHNLKIILNNIQHYYEQKDYLIMRLPNIDRLVKDPEHNTDEAACLINLLIGCAQLCPEKDYFFESFRKLQHQSMDSIHQSTALTSKLAVYVFNCKMLTSVERQDRESNTRLIFKYILNLHTERDALQEFIRQRCVLPTCDDDSNTEAAEFSLQDVYRALHDAKFNNPISEYIVELSRIKDQERTSRVKIDMLNDKLHRLLLETHDLKAKNVELQRVNHNLDLKAKEAQYYHNVADMLSFEASKINHLMSVNKQLNYKIDELSAYKRQADYLHEQNEKLLDAMDDSDTRYTEFKTNADRRLRDLMKQNIELKQKLARKMKARSLNGSFEEKDASDTSDESLFEDSLEIVHDVREILCKKADLESKLEKAQLEIAYQKVYIENLKLSYKDWEIKKTELAGLSAEADRLQLELTKVSEERERLLRKYQWLKKKHRRLDETSRVQENELRRSQAQLTEVQKQASELAGRCDQYRQAQLELIREKSKLVESNEELRRQNKEYAEKWTTEFRACREERDSLARAKVRLEQKIIDQFQMMQNSANKKKANKGNRVRDVLERIRRHSAFFLKGRSGEQPDEAPLDDRDEDEDDDEDDFDDSSTFFRNMENDVATPTKKSPARISRRHSAFCPSRRSMDKESEHRVTDVFGNYFAGASQKFWKEETVVGLPPFDYNAHEVVYANLVNVRESTQLPDNSGVPKFHDETVSMKQRSMST